MAKLSPIEKAREAFLAARAHLASGDAREDHLHPQPGSIKRSALRAVTEAGNEYLRAVLVDADPRACASDEYSLLKRISKDPLVHDQGHRLVVRAQACAS